MKNEYVIVVSSNGSVFSGYSNYFSNSEDICGKNNQILLKNSRKLCDFQSELPSISRLCMKGVIVTDITKFECEVQMLKIVGFTHVYLCTKESELSIRMSTIWENKNYDQDDSEFDVVF